MKAILLSLGLLLAFAPVSYAKNGCTKGQCVDNGGECDGCKDMTETQCIASLSNPNSNPYKVPCPSDRDKQCTRCGGGYFSKASGSWKKQNSTVKSIQLKTKAKLKLTLKAKAQRCRKYAFTARKHYTYSRKNRCKLRGFGWSSNFSHHYRWCMKVSKSAAQKLARKRIQKLRICILKQRAKARAARAKKLRKIKKR